MLSVSSGPSQLQMPELVGMNIEDATALLKSMGFSPTYERVINGDYALDCVVSQIPAAYEKVDKETQVHMTISGGKTVVPMLRNLTLAEAEEVLKQNQLRMSPVLTYVDTRNAKEHGRITSQSPADSIEVMLDAEVSLNVYRYPTSKAQQDIDITLPESEEDVNVRVVLVAEDSEVEIEAFQHAYPPDLGRQQRITVNLPDERKYECTIYINGEPGEPFEAGN